MRNRFAAAMSGAAMGGLLLSGCGNGSEAESVDLPEDIGGDLTILCTPDEVLCAAWAEAFEAETGVSTNYVRLSSGEAVARLQSAGDDTSEFDVWHGGPVDGYVAAQEEGLIAPYESEVANELDEDVVDPDGYWAGVYLGALGFCSNEDRLEELGISAPESWDDLLADELSSEIMMAHPSTSGTAFTALWSQVERLGGEEEALDYMRDFNQNVLQYSRSGSAPAQAAGRGEVAVSIVFSHDCTAHQEEGFDNLVTSFPAEGTGYEIGGVGLIEGSGNEDAAKAYIDWALSPAAQNLGPENNSLQVLTHPDAETDDRMIPLEDITLVDYDFVAAGYQRSELTQRFDEEIAEEPAEDEE